MREDGEFVATKARNRIAVAHGKPESPSYFLEDAVAALMAECVIDLLEPIKVKHEDCETLSSASSEKNCLFNSIPKENSIWKSAQMIVERLMLNLVNVFAESAGDSSQDREKGNVEGKQGNRRPPASGRNAARVAFATGR